jgi:hypothetical protein
MTNPHEKSVLMVETTGFVIEAAAGVAVIVLSIIALVRGDNGLLTAIAGIVLGGALFAQGAAIAGEYSNLLEMLTSKSQSGIALGGGLAIEIIAGTGAIVLGILALLGIYPEVLLAVAVIVGGAAMILAAGGLDRLNSLKVRAANLSPLGEDVAKNAVTGAIGFQVLAGGATVVLGILALSMPVHASLLTLVGLLVLGGALMFNGSAFTGRLLQLFRSKY